VALRIKADPVEADGKLHTFYYYPLNQDEAKAAAKAQAAASPNYVFEAKFDRHAKSFFVHVTPKCPDAIPAKTGYKIWEACFDKKGAGKQVKRRSENRSRSD
jgi:hypothetical protein